MIAIEADEVFFKANGTPEGGFWAEAIVVLPTCRSQPLSLTLRVTTLVPLLFSQLQCWTAGPWEGW